MPSSIYSRFEATGCRNACLPAAALSMQMRARPYNIIDGVAENPSSASETWKKKLYRNQRNGKRISPLNPRCFANQQHVWAVVVTVVACERYIHFSSLFWASIHCNLSQVLINVCSALCYIHVVRINFLINTRRFMSLSWQTNLMPHPQFIVTK